MTSDKEMILRWRLMLGEFAQDELPLEGEYSQMDGCLSFLYDREYSEGRGMRGGRERSRLAAPEWIRKIKKLFPKKAVEIMQEDALDKYDIREILYYPEILKDFKADMALLAKLLEFRGAIPTELRRKADDIIRRTAEEISDKLENQVRRCFYGKRINSTQSCRKISKNFDFDTTVRRNLKNYSTKYRTIIPQRLYFKNTVKRYNPWEVIILVDQSGSMTNSVIHSAVMASIFARLPFLRIRLVAFDTSVVDLTDYVHDCTELLLKVQLGGGTDISKALGYVQDKILNPRKTILLLVSDLEEGRDKNNMYRRCKDILESGSRLLVLTALDYNVTPVYNKSAAKALKAMGADVSSTTPEGLADWIADIIS